MPEGGTMPTEYLGRADSAVVESNEDGFELIITTNYGRYTVNVHAISLDLLETVKKEIGSYWAEGRAAAAAHQRGTDRLLADIANADAYPANDPKNLNYHSVHADLYDSREGK